MFCVLASLELLRGHFSIYHMNINIDLGGQNLVNLTSKNIKDNVFKNDCTAMVTNKTDIVRFHRFAHHRRI